MPNRVLLEEFHLTVNVLESLSDSERELLRRILASRKFRSALRRAIRDLLAGFPSLIGLRIALTV